MMDKEQNISGNPDNATPAGEAVRVEPTLNAAPQAHAEVQAAADEGGREEAAQPGWFARMVSHPRAPFIVGAVALVIAGAYFGRGYLPQIGSPNIVVFDPVKFANAQRAAASILAVSPSADLQLTLTQVAKNAEPVIREEAHGAVVLVKQAVVTPEGMPDITDAVLRHFGLPTTVPTVSTEPGKLTLESLAPTDSSYSAGKQAEDYRMELRSRDMQAAQANAKADAQNKVLP
jgi:hypothetical protein